MNEIWLYVSLFGVWLSQILIGMYIAIIIFERRIGDGDDPYLLPGVIDSDDKRVVNISDNKERN